MVITCAPPSSPQAECEIICHDACPAQHEADPAFPERSVCFGGHGTEPNEQKTQQSPDFGRNFIPQPVHT
jgi:hypothetical protein